MEVFLLKNNTKKLLCILLAIAAAVCVIFACFMLTKHKQTDSASSAAASVSQFGSVADFDYEAFDYSDGLDENGYWSGIKALDYVTLPEDFGSIALKENDLNPTEDELQQQVDNLLNQGAASFIFDVRDNIGENLNAALVCADYCVPSGVIAQQEDKDGSITLLRMSDENEVTVPMVVLVNGSTSDGAELFANALRKMNSATIVGTRTAGKGVVMSDAQSFSDGSAAYITIGLLLDNEGQSWNDLGLTPDVDATLSSDEQNAYYDYTVDTDPQISKALNTAKMLSGQN